MKHNVIRHGHMHKIVNIVKGICRKGQNGWYMPEDIKALNDNWKWFVIELDNDSWIIDPKNNRGDYRSDAEVKDFSIFKKYYYKQASALGIVG